MHNIPQIPSRGVALLFKLFLFNDWELYLGGGPPLPPPGQEIQEKVDAASSPLNSSVHDDVI